jgi:hypothetical protein
MVANCCENEADMLNDILLFGGQQLSNSSLVEWALDSLPLPLP